MFLSRTLQDHMIKALNEFMIRSPLKVCQHLTMFGGHKHCVGGEIKVLIWKGISQDHVIKVSYDFMGTSSLM